MAQSYNPPLMAAGQRTLLTLGPREERGSRASRRLRRAGLVPGVIYGVGSDSISFKVDARHLRGVLAEGHALFDVEIDGSGRQPVIVKDQHRDPVRGRVLHLDLLKVRLDEKIHSTVVLEIEGAEDAPGVREGGVMEQVTRELNVSALPTDIPDRIVADVSGLGIAETMVLSAVVPPEGVEFLDEPEETVVATVSAPTAVEEPEALEEEVEEVGAEGETAEEAEAAAEGGEEGAAEGGEES
jgi:large subunit ribosomal protein L25